jgi:hypothetical protein
MFQQRFGRAIARLMFVAVTLIFSAASWAAPISFDHSAAPSEAVSALVPFRHRISVAAAELAAMQPGQTFSVSIPGHSSPFAIVYDRTEVSPIGPTTWIGHLQGSADYRTVITNFGGHSVGEIGTPEGLFHIETVNGVTSLIDLQRQGYKKPAYKNDAMSTRSKAAAIDDKQAATPIPAMSGAAPAAAGNSVIDVLVIYNPSFVIATGNAQGAIASVIATANQAMLDSNVPLTFRVVATQQFNISDADDNDVLLQKITYPSDPRLVSSSFSDPTYTGLPALRTQYGADLVVAIRQFGPSQTSCGIAWLLDQLGSGTAQAISESAPDAYAVVSYGQYQVTSNEYFLCDQVTTAHEMGHNLGLAHDYAHAQLSDGTHPAAFPYSYGYGFVNGFATIMAANYISPATVVAKYSSPNLTCLGSPCGVAGNTAGTSANNAAALLITGPLGAQFMPTKVATVATITPATGYWWNPAEPYRGYNIEQRGSNLFMAAFLYSQSGATTWFGVGPGPIVNGVYTGQLATYAGGQTLFGSYRGAGSVVANAGAITVTFTSATQGSIVWPGGTVPIQRYDFGPGGSSATPPAGTPQAGWWWAPSEGGRGFAVEIQGNSMFLAGYMYDNSGTAIWYAAGPTPMSGLNYLGVWQQYANGQTLTGSYKPATVINTDVGPATIQFTSTTTGQMTFPDGHTVMIERYAF